MRAFLDPRHFTHRLICIALTYLTAFTPAARTMAQAPENGGALEYVVPNACAVLVVRPKQILATESLKMLPLEVIQAAGLQYTGIDPLQIEQLVLSVSPPAGGPPAYALHGKFAKPYEFKPNQIAMHTVPGELDGKPYLKSQQPMLPSFFSPGRTSVLAAPDVVLSQLVDGTAAANSLATQASTESAGDDLYLLLDIQALKPIFQMALSNVPPSFPISSRTLMEIPERTKSIELTVNVSNLSMTELLLTANSESDAERLEMVFEEAKSVLQQMMINSMQSDGQAQRMLSSDDPVEQAMGRYVQRLQREMTNSIQDAKLTRDGAEFKLVQIDPTTAGENPLVTVAVVGFLVALLLPAVQAAREAARRAQAMNHTKMILLSLLNYESVHKAFPAHATYDDNGKPLLSWRVHVLPFLEEQELYEKFHLDEPWDSDHNKKLIPLMPEVFLDPSSRLSTEQGRANLIGVKGKGMFFDGTSKPRGIPDIRDGTSNTIAIVQVNDDRAPIWTQPEDWEVNENNLTKGLGGLHPGIFIAGFCDGHVSVFAEQVDTKLLRSMFTVDGGEIGEFIDGGF